jgi:3-deoxy-D-manno-octulosonate 8-phosphate phosphatase (KDO 8-P phosphatase)
LGITDIHLGSANKVETLTNIPMCTTLSQNSTGDDIPDYHVMKLVGLPTCPQDASPEIKEFQNIQNGKALFAMIEQAMKVQGKWMEL